MQKVKIKSFSMGESDGDILCVSVNEKKTVVMDECHDEREVSDRDEETIYQYPTLEITAVVTLQNYINTLRHLFSVCLFVYFCSIMIVSGGFFVALFIEYEDEMLERVDKTAMSIFATCSIFSLLTLPLLCLFYKKQMRRIDASFAVLVSK